MANDIEEAIADPSSHVWRARAFGVTTEKMSWPELVDAAKTQRVTTTHLMKPEGFDDWIPASQIDGIELSSPPLKLQTCAITMTCKACKVAKGRDCFQLFEKGALALSVCNACLALHKTEVRSATLGVQDRMQAAKARKRLSEAGRKLRSKPLDLRPVLSGAIVVLLLSMCLIPAIVGGTNSNNIVADRGTSSSPPLRFSDEWPAGSPGPYGTPKEWERYYNTPEGRKQLARDAADLERQLKDPETSRRVKEILDRHK